MNWVNLFKALNQGNGVKFPAGVHLETGVFVGKFPKIFFLGSIGPKKTTKQILSAFWRLEIEIRV